MSGRAADNPADRRIMAQSFGIVDIFVSGKTAEYGLTQHSNKSVPAIFAGPCIRESVAGHRGQATHVVEFPVGQQSGVRGDDRTTKLEDQLAVGIELENFTSRFTRRVRHGRSFKSNITC